MEETNYVASLVTVKLYQQNQPHCGFRKIKKGFISMKNITWYIQQSIPKRSVKGLCSPLL